MDTFWKNKYGGLLGTISAKTDLNEKQVVEILDSYFYGIKTFLSLPSVPIVKTKFISFHPDKNYLKKTIRLFKNGKIDHGNLKSKFDRYWKVLDRVKEEARGRVSNFLWLRIENLARKKKDLTLNEIFNKSIIRGNR